MLEQVGTKILSSQKITESPLYFSLDLIFLFFYSTLDQLEIQSNFVFSRTEQLIQKWNHYFYASLYNNK